MVWCGVAWCDLARYAESLRVAGEVQAVSPLCTATLRTTRLVDASLQETGRVAVVVESRGVLRA